MSNITNDSNTGKLKYILREIMQYSAEALSDLSTTNLEPEKVRINRLTCTLDRVKSRAQNAIDIFNYIQTNPTPDR